MSDRASLLHRRTSRPLLIDGYCCQGGAGKGYHDAGFDVIGIDINPQPRYPFPFIQMDVLEFLRKGMPILDWRRPVAVHVSPPCQHDSDCQRIQGREHPDLIGPTRELLEHTGLPYVIENVKGAVPKLRDPVMICGPMVGVDMYRHRYFETNWPLTVPLHAEHTAPQVKMGRSPKPGEFIQAVGNFAGVQQAREVMGMPWANRDGLREAIPPAYTRFIGTQLLSWLRDAERQPHDSSPERIRGSVASLGRRTGSRPSTDDPADNASFGCLPLEGFEESGGSFLQSDRGRDVAA